METIILYLYSQKPMCNNVLIKEFLGQIGVVSLEIGVAPHLNVSKGSD